jgi:outer membrane protein assembly factor BamE
MTAKAMRTTTQITRPIARIILIAMLGLGSGCLYRMPVQQGNVLNPEQVAQLEAGMTRSQVSFLLGTPMVPNGFNTDRWDYYYYVRGARGETLSTKRLVVWFKDEKVDRFEGDAVAPPKAAATKESAPAPTPNAG